MALTTSTGVRVSIPAKMLGLDPATKMLLQERLALLAIGMIRRRTKQGLDMHGAPFASYSKPYARQRDRSGRQTKPDLWLTGQMLGSMSVLSSDVHAAVIGFSGSSLATRFQKSKPRKAKRTGKRLTGTFSTTGRGGRAPRTIPNGLKATWNQRLRPFFGLSPAEVQALTREATRILTIK